MTRTLFLDLDGVMADFDGHYPSLFGHHQKEVSDNQMWKNIHGVGDFFLSMPLCEGAVDFLHFLHCDLGVTPVILTACPSSNYAPVALQKKRWVAQHLGEHLRVLPVMGGKNKFLFMNKPGDLLIDDYEKNLIPWNEAEGHTIHHCGDWDMTRHETALWEGMFR